MDILDELLAEEASTYTNDELIVNADDRTIYVPNTLAGVFSDEKSTRLKFRCPKSVGDNVDLSAMNVYINFRNANGEIYSYLTDDVTVDGENITFSWLLSRDVTTYKGNVNFIVCAKKIQSDGKITIEWNTTLATLTVLEGLEPADNYIPTEKVDVATELMNAVNTLTEEVNGVKNSIKDFIPDEYITEAELNAHTSNNDVHVTTADRSKWNSKLDSNQGTSNAGKLLGTNSNGDVVAIQGYGFEYNEETKMLEYGTDPTTNLNQGIGLDDTLSKKGYAAEASAVGELKSDFVNYENSLSKLVESNYDGIIEFKIGIWTRIEGKYVLSDDINNRLSADLRPLNLKAGDTVGIIDYDTYSIAFGDNDNDNDMPNHKPWYANGYNSSDITADDSNTEPNVILVKRNDEGLITQTDIEEISKQFHCTSKKTNMTFSKIAIDEINKRIEKNKNSFLHFSFDDVSLCLINLSSSNFDSIFDEPFFNMLKGFHDRYNTVFSLYVWNISELSNIPTKYKKEFVDNSDWLKFGFHALTSGSLADASYETALNEYNSFVNTIYEKCGGINSIDRMPRLNCFGGSLDACMALCDAECGCLGFLNTDDSRNTYYLNSDVLSYLRNHSKYSDINNGIQFMSTVMRLDWFVSGFSSSYTYNKPVKDNPYDELVYRYNDPAFADLYHNLIVFTHEWQTYNSNYTLINDMVDRIEQVCKFGYDYNYDNDYPQNRVEDIRNYKLSNDNLYFDWEFGAIDSGGILVESSTRVRTKPIHAKNLVVKVPNGYKVNICKYSSDNVSDSTFISRTDWATKSQILNDKAWYVIVVSTINNTATIDIGDNFVINADLIN